MYLFVYLFIYLVLDHTMMWRSISLHYYYIRVKGREIHVWSGKSENLEKKHRKFYTLLQKL